MNKKIYLIVLAITTFLFIFSFALNASAKVPDTEIKVKETPIPVKQQFEHDAEIKFQEYENRITITDEEVALIARVVMSEASILDDDAKVLVAHSVKCRLRKGYWGETISDVINYPNAYSTQDNGEPTIECYKAVYQAFENEVAPHDLYYFRTDKPHDFGYVYAHIGNTYFTTETDWERRVNDLSD